jgi:rhodanese-related sulfurtransferase
MRTSSLLLLTAGLQLAALSTAVAAAPIVSGPGACGARAVDNAAFVSCIDDQPAAPGRAADGGQQGFRPMYIQPREARRLKAEGSDKLLLVDVRSRAEVVFTGMPAGFDVHVPFMEPAADYRWDARLGQVAMDYNLSFLRDLDSALVAAGMRHSQPVVLLCRSGEASAKAAELLVEYGYEQVFVVLGGFEGPGQTLAGGQLAPDELGWKSAGLPWTAAIEPARFYHGGH